MISMAIKYPPLIKIAGFTVKPNETNDLSLEKFIENANLALNKKDFESAVSNAELAALRYGVPGLVLYYKVRMKQLNQDKNDHELIQVDAHNLLIILLLAEKLFPHETQAQELINKNFSEYCNQSKEVDWSKMKSDLIQLGELSGWKSDDEKDAQALYKACLHSLQYGYYLGKQPGLTKLQLTDAEVIEGKTICKTVLVSLELFATNKPKITSAFLKKPDIITERFSITTYDGATLDTFMVSPRQSSTPVDEQLHIIQLVGSGMCYQQILDSMHLMATTLDSRVIGFNYRGVCSSHGEPVSLDDLLVDAITQVQRLLDNGIAAEKIMLYGHSLGGYISTFVVEYFQQQGVMINLFNDRSLSTKLEHFKAHNKDSKTLTKLERYGWTRDAAAAFARLKKSTKDYIVVRTPKSARNESTVDDKTIPHSASLHVGLKKLNGAYKSHKFHPRHSAYNNYHSVDLWELASNLDPNITAWDYFCAFSKRVALQKYHYPTCFANFFQLLSEPTPEDQSKIDFKTLVSNTRTAISNQQIEKAHELALKALANDTFTGLILYYFVGMAELQKVEKESEVIALSGTKYLEFLLLAEKLSAAEPEATQLVLDCLPEYHLNGEINWTSMKDNLIQLAELKNSISTAEQKAEIFYQTLSETYKTTHSVSFSKSLY